MGLAGKVDGQFDEVVYSVHVQMCLLLFVFAETKQKKQYELDKLRVNYS